MTNKLKELVTQLRVARVNSVAMRDEAADTIEELAEDVEKQTRFKKAWIRRAEAAEAERDRLKDMLGEAVKWMNGCVVSGVYPAWHTNARKALGGEG